MHHLELQLSQLSGKESLEEIYLRDRCSYLFHKLAWIQEFFDRKKLAQELAYLVMVVYIYDYIDRLGMRFADRILRSLSFLQWELERFRPLLGLNTDAKIAMAVALEYAERPPDEKEKIAELVSTAYAWLGLARTRSFSEVEERKRWLYSLLNSEPEQKRRKLIEGSDARELRLVNIGLAVTEQCPNSCTFCLSPWKPSCRERLGRELEEEEFRVIADEVIGFADSKGLILTLTGGEPFLEMERLKYILRHAKTRTDITTSAWWARSEARARSTMEEILSAASENRSENFRFTLQLSLDAFHQEVRFERGEFVEHVPLQAVANVLRLAIEEFQELELVLLTKLTCYHDPLARLLRLMEELGYSVRLENTSVEPGIQVSTGVPEKGILQAPALLRGYLNFGKGKPVLVFYTLVESMGRAMLLEEFEYPSLRAQVEELLSGRSLRLPLTGIEVSDDGHVYPGAHAMYTWSAGNVLEESLEEIVERLERDPLVQALAEKPQELVKIAEEVEPEVRKVLKKASSPLAALYMLFETPWLRLYLTRRLMGESREEAEEEYRRYREKYSGG